MYRKRYTDTTDTHMRADYDKVVNAVAEAMDLTTSQVVSKRKYQETTEARRIVVYILREMGYCSNRIAIWMGMTSRNVNLILSSMNYRIHREKQLRTILESARKYL